MTKKKYSPCFSLSWQLKWFIKVLVMSSKWPMRPFGDGGKKEKKRKVTDMASQRRQVKASRTNYWAGHLTARQARTHTHPHKGMGMSIACLSLKGPLVFLFFQSCCVAKVPEALFLQAVMCCAQIWFEQALWSQMATRNIFKTAHMIRRLWVAVQREYLCSLIGLLWLNSHCADCL